MEMFFLNIMIALYIVSVFKTVETGLFDLAARHGGNEPLWRQVKALERVHTFLESVQTEIKASRDLLKHVHFKDLVPALRTNKTSRRKTTRTMPMPMMYTNNYFSALVADFMDYGPKPKTKMSATTTSTKAPTSTAVQFSDIVPADIPHDELMYKDINSIFRVAAPDRQIEPYAEMRAKANDYKSNMDYNQYPVNRDSAHRQRITLVTEPPRRPIIKINDYSTPQEEPNANHDYEATELPKTNTEQVLREDPNEMNEDVYYNKYKNLGQKRFIIVTQSWRETYSRERTTTSSQTNSVNLVQRKIFERPTTDYRTWTTHKPILRAQEREIEDNITTNTNIETPEQSTEKNVEHKISNDNLRKIIESSSYSDDETALVVNLMDHLYHYNRTINDTDRAL